MANIKLRDYQKEAVLALRNNEKGIIAAATGSGKTTMMAASIKEKVKYGKILVLVHLQQLVVQTKERIESETGIKTGMYYQNTKDEFDDFKVMVATWQSLSKLTKKNDLSKDLFYTINVDEAHHINKDYLDTVLFFIPNFLHGFTATPYGSGESILFFVFEKIIFSIDIFELIEKGYLSRMNITVYRGNSKHLSPILQDDYNKKKEKYIQELENEISIENRIPKVVHFFKNKNHINKFTAGIDKEDANIYTSDLSSKKNSALIQQFNKEKSKVNHLYSIRMLNEGIDIPIINGLIFHETGGSFRTLTQRLGRGLRVYKNPKHITYIKQFLEEEDEFQFELVINFHNEIQLALSSRKGKKKNFQNLVIIKYDQDTESFIENYKKKLEEKEKRNKPVIIKCARCNKPIIVLNTMTEILREGDEFICKECGQGQKVLTSCDKMVDGFRCNTEIIKEYRNYRGFIVDKSKFYCKAHSPKHSKKINVKCYVCGTEFKMLAGKYNGRIKNNSLKFFCKDHKNYKWTPEVECCICHTKFNIRLAKYNNNIKKNINFYCQKHTQTMNKPSMVQKIIETCEYCGKEFEISKSKLEKLQKSSSRILCNSHINTLPKKIVNCSICGSSFKVMKRTFDAYTQKGNSFLCEEHKYKIEKDQVHCYNCGDLFEVSDKRFKEYHKSGQNFHCTNCRQLISR